MIKLFFVICFLGVAGGATAQACSCNVTAASTNLGTCDLGWSVDSSSEYGFGANELDRCIRFGNRFKKKFPNRHIEVKLYCGSGAETTALIQNAIGCGDARKE